MNNQTEWDSTLSLLRRLRFPVGPGWLFVACVAGAVVCPWLYRGRITHSTAISQWEALYSLVGAAIFLLVMCLVQISQSHGKIRIRSLIELTACVGLLMHLYVDWKSYEAKLENELTELQNWADEKAAELEADGL